MKVVVVAAVVMTGRIYKNYLKLVLMLCNGPKQKRYNNETLNLFY